MLSNICGPPRTSDTYFINPACPPSAFIVRSTHRTSSTRTAGYNISFYGTTGTFHNRSVKQTAVATSSTHAEARAIFTLAKELNFIIALCQELRIPLELPAVIMEDNSAVVTMANSDSGYTKKCKHFLMVLNYIKEQIALGQIEARKIYGKLNTADMHTKPLRSAEFLAMAHKILGHPPPPSPPTVLTDIRQPISASTSVILRPAETVSSHDMDVEGQPSLETKRSLALDPATTTNVSGERRISFVISLDRLRIRQCERM